MKQRFHFAFCVALAWALAGCATTPTSYDVGTHALNTGDHTSAERLLLQAVQSGEKPGSAWNNLGVVYTRTNRPEQAQSAYVMAARYGNESGRLNLIKLNKQVPAPDLAQINKTDSSGASAALQLLGAAASGYNEGRSAGASRDLPLTPTETKCESSMGYGRTVVTTCKQK